MHWRSALAAAAVLLTGFVQRTAAAATDSGAVQPSVQPNAHWYGWQTLIVLAPFDATLIAVAATWRRDSLPGKAALLTIGLMGHAVGPLVVHDVHHHNTSWSVLLNVAIPAALGTLSFFAVAANLDGTPRTGEAIGFVALGSLAVGNVIDVAFLSTGRAGDAPRRALSLTPLAGGGRAGLRIGTSF